MNLSQKIFDLGFGDPVCVRDSLMNHYTMPINLVKLNEITYPDPIGNEELIKLLVSFKKLTGTEYVILTTGATQGINLILRALKKEGKFTISKNTPCFMYYDDIIDRAGFIRQNEWSTDTDVVLFDWPSNPSGWLNHGWLAFDNDYIWDSVYYSPTYVNDLKIDPPKGWRFRIGGFSKLFGLSGLRVGWVVCQNKKDFDALSYELKYENCGISSVSQLIATDVMKSINFDNFFKESKNRINMNREQMLKIVRIFDYQEIPKNGMFYPFRANKKSISILNKANVKFITMVEGKEPLIRLSLGQNNLLTEEAVKSVLKADKIRSKK